MISSIFKGFVPASSVGLCWKGEKMGVLVGFQGPAQPVLFYIWSPCPWGWTTSFTSNHLGLSSGQMEIPQLQLIRCYTVIINCSIIFFSSAFACNYLLLAKGHQSIKCEMEKQIESSRIFQSTLFFSNNSYLCQFFFLILTFSIKMSSFCPYSLNTSCCSCPLIAEDIEMSSSLKPAPPKRSIFISAIQFYWASTSNYYPLTFMLLKGADMGL